MKSKILGYGEIGKSLEEVYRLNNIDVAWKDLNGSYGDIDCELLNVCIPYNDKFIESVIAEISLSGCKYVVIHSTVSPGVTRTIGDITNKVVCHSPVIGVHPNLRESLLTFTKWFGGGNSDIIEHFINLGMNAVLMDENPEATEVMKLWDTTYYGMCLAINAEVKEMLVEYGISYDKWVDYLMEYNNGYEKMNMSNVKRPYFRKLKMPIGGHCIVPNYKVLTKVNNNLLELLELIKKHS